MPLSVLRLLVPLALAFGLATAGAQPAAAGPQVMGWVPAYAIPATLKALDANPAIGHALTRIGLQFWNPSVDGRGVVLAPVDATGKPVTPAQVRTLRTWARAHGVQPLLTVYNNSQVVNRWDWSLAQRAFADHPQAFAAALVEAVDTWQLDGVDLDLEGEGDLAADRAAYAAFVHRLAAALRAKGKFLTIDSFHSPCDNAPNMGWWADWTGDVTTIHSMGYEDLYEGSTASFTPEGRPVCEGGAAVFRYSWQLGWGVKAGYRRDQIVMGMPTWVDRWGSGGKGPTVVDHLRELRALGAGAALWDLQLNAPGWNTPATWSAVRALRRRAGTLAGRPPRRDEIAASDAPQAVPASARGTAAPRHRPTAAAAAR